MDDINWLNTVRRLLDAPTPRSLMERLVYNWSGINGRLQESREAVSALLNYPTSNPPWLSTGDAIYIVNQPFLLALKVSEVLLPAYATLDNKLVHSVGRLLINLAEYMDDDSRSRPCNVLLIAPPGSGKSHFVKCLAARLKASPVIADLSSPDPFAALSFAVDQARNYKAQDAFPLLFLDEVDSGPSYIPASLPFLYDGEIFLGGRTLKLGRCIIICAASNPALVSQLGPASLGQEAPEPVGFQIPKLVDFLSRFNAGVFEVPSITAASRGLDRPCVAAQLIRRRFPHLETVPIGVLQFLSFVSVNHGVRSIECLINLMPRSGIKKRHVVGLPEIDITDMEEPQVRANLFGVFSAPLGEDEYAQGPLRFHIAESQRENALKLWKRVSECKVQVRIRDHPDIIERMDQGAKESELDQREESE